MNTVVQTKVNESAWIRSLRVSNDKGLLGLGGRGRQLSDFFGPLFRIFPFPSPSPSLCFWFSAFAKPNRNKSLISAVNVTAHGSRYRTNPSSRRQKCGFWLAGWLASISHRDATPLLQLELEVSTVLLLAPHMGARNWHPSGTGKQASRKAPLKPKNKKKQKQIGVRQQTRDIYPSKPNHR